MVGLEVEDMQRKEGSEVPGYAAPPTSSVCSDSLLCVKAELE